MTKDKDPLTGDISKIDIKNETTNFLKSFSFKNNEPVVGIKPDYHGKYIACLTELQNIVIVSGDLSRIICEIKLAGIVRKEFGEFSFTPDSRFLLNGDEEGSVRIYNIEKGCEIAKYSSHIKACKCVKFSPCFVMFASACQNVILWIPKFWDKN